MRLQDDIDFTTLTWVKAELDETLKQARHALEAYVEDPADASQMRFCATYLHQVQGTLRMVELYGAAMVTEEMEHLASALLENDVKDRDDAYAVLMRGIVQLPDYLERLQTGHKDIPIVLLPLLNDLRGARGEKGLSEIVLFTPDLSRPLPISAKGPLASLPELELRQIAEQLRGQFQLALLNWFRNLDVDTNVARIAQVCDKLVAIVSQEEARRLFWVAAGVLDALRAKAFEPSPQLKQTIGKVEREIKRLADAGEASFRVDPPRELTRNLLYFVAHAPTEHGRIGELRQVFRLDRLLPTEAEIAHARGSMSGHNRALLDTVSVAIKEDLMRVKDALDIHLRNQNLSPAGLASQVEVLDRVSDTLGMLGLGVARRVVQEQRTAVSQVAEGTRNADEATLLDIAGALLYVEASLDDQVQHLGGSAAEDAGGRPLPQAEARKVLDVLIKEAQANFAQAKQCFVAFVESSWDHAQLQDVPRLLDEVAGAMRILELQDAPQYLLGVRRFTEAELIARHRVPNGQQMDTLADALASLEYYLEAVREHRSGRDKILDVTRTSLESLGYWPVPAEADVMPTPVAAPAIADAAPTPEPAAEIAAPAASSPPSAPAPLVEAATPAPVVATDAPGPAPVPAAPVSAAPPSVGVSLVGFEGSSDEIDEEIREVFVEEVQEEISNLQDLLPVWKADPTGVETLKPIRRVFHTLKGSGRLVGALTLGEFSWKLENMLNRVLDKSIQPTPAVVAIIEHAQHVLPALLAALRGDTGARADVEGIKAVADRLAAGEQAWYEAPVAAPVVVEAASPEPSPAPEVEYPVAAEPAVEAEVEDEPRHAVPAITIDPVLFDILKAEVAGHLDTMHEYLDAANASPKPATDSLLRAVHTMNGAFAMTDVPVITEVIGPLEGYIKRLLAQGATPGNRGLAAIGDAAEAVRMLMVELDSPRPQLPELGELAARIIAERDSLPEPVGPSVPLHLDIEDDFTELTEAVSIQSDGELSDTPAEPVELEHASEETFASFGSDGAGFEAEARAATQDESVFVDARPEPAAVRADDLAMAFLPFEASSDAAAPADASRAADAAAVESGDGEPVADGAAGVFLIDQGSIEVDRASPEVAPVDANAPVEATSADADRLPEMSEAVASVESIDFAEAAAADLGFDVVEADSRDPGADAGEAILADPYSIEEISLEEPQVTEPELGEPGAAALLAEAAAPDSPAPASVATDASALEETSFDEWHIDRVRAGEAPQPVVDATAPREDESAFEAELLALGDLDVGIDPAVDFEIIEHEDAPADAVGSGNTTDEAGREALETEASASSAATAPGVASTDAEVSALDALIAAYGIDATPPAATVEGTRASDVADEAEASATPLDEDADLADLDIDFSYAEQTDAIGVLDAEAGIVLEAAPETTADLIEGVAGFEQGDAGSIDSESASREPEAHAYETARAADLEQARVQAEADAAAQAAADAEAEAEAAERAEADARHAAEAEAAALAEAEAAAVAAREAEELAELEAEIAALEAAEAEAAAATAAAALLAAQAQSDAEAEAAFDPSDVPGDAPAFAERDESEPMLPVEPLADFAAEADAEAAEQLAADLAAAGPNLSDADPDPDGALDLPDLDEDLLDIFLEEGGDILDHSDGLMARLRETPGERDIVVELQRDLHTLKGGARMAGIAPIGDLGHAMESLLEAVAEGKRDLGRAGVETLERCFDRLHTMVTRVGQRRALAMPVTLIERVEALSRGETLVPYAPGTAGTIAPATAVVEPIAPMPEDADAQVPGEAAVANPQGQLSEPMPEEDDISVRAPQEQIRIRADLLDRLVNYAGEVAIYRARLEQQLGLFRGNLGELDQTTTRLREQLRKLEIETEAQIVARYQREAEVGDSAFDPLELDRFSTLQQLSRALSESAADIVNLQTTLEDHTRQYETLLLQQSRVSSELQEGLMRTRMVPFDSLVPRLRRIIRQTAGELGKKAQLKVEGAQGEMDRNVLDRMTAPLEHMLRNALAHGLESPADRLAAGKADEGTVKISVRREGSEVVILVSDDGRGLDRDAIRRKAIERGLMKPDAQLSDRDLYGFILETGFSTATSVSKIAGRGVGMDVVHSEIRQLGGSLYIESERGKGSEFVVRLPFTLAVTQAVFVKHGDTSFAVPIASVQGVARIERSALEAQLASGEPNFRYAGEDYAIYDLGLLLGQSHVRAEESLQVPLMLARSGDLRAAICVDHVIGSREIVVKPVGPQVSSIPGIFGATIMGDGRVIVILDVAPLVRRSAALRKSGDAPQLPPAPVEQRRIPLVMVVDDSITMRKVTGRVLERHNYEVITAKDGVDAIEKLQERIPDVMLLDIEMPRMDGYELATHMRNDGRLRGIPIIMITSRTGEKHRQRAFEIGVDRYLGKPYQENELMRNVHEILKVGRGSVG